VLSKYFSGKMARPLRNICPFAYDNIRNADTSDDLIEVPVLFKMFMHGIKVKDPNPNPNVDNTTFFSLFQSGTQDTTFSIRTTCISEVAGYIMSNIHNTRSP